jgi:hypothetical protein
MLYATMAGAISKVNGILAERGVPSGTRGSICGAAILLHRKSFVAIV